MGSETAPSGLANQRAVRRHNLGVVLRHVSDHGPRSRATIALETGLNKTTVSSLVTELIGLDLLVERGLEQRGTVGRPGPGRRAVRRRRRGARAGDQRRLPRRARARPHGRRPPPQPRRARQPQRAGRARCSTGWATSPRRRSTRCRPRACGRSARRWRCPGSSTRRAVRCSWRPTSAGPTSRSSTSCTSGCPARRSRWPPTTRPTSRRWPSCGRAPRAGFSDVLYVSGEIGVGAGIIIGGELFRGAQGFGGEFGHMTLDPGGKPCACGSRGCLETVAGLEALLEMAGLDPSDAATTTGSGEPVATLAGARARRRREGARGAARGRPLARHRDRLGGQPPQLPGRGARRLLRPALDLAGGADRARARDPRAGLRLGRPARCCRRRSGPRRPSAAPPRSRCGACSPTLRRPPRPYDYTL